MSGHSKWSTIKRKKGALDSKRANIFTKLAKNIAIAARDGDDPDMNFRLKLAIDQAKASNMPKDNIQRAVDRGAGNTDEGQLTEAVYEGYGPEGTALVIETVTDNTNRTVAEVKAILAKHNGSLGSPGCAAWMFEKKGVIEIDLGQTDKASDEIQMLAIELEALDTEEDGKILYIYTDPKNLGKTVKSLEDQGIKITNQSLDMIAKDEIKISEDSKAKLEKIFEALEESDDVTNYYTNAQA